MQTTSAGSIVRPGDGRELPGILFKVAAEQAAGSFSLVEHSYPPGVRIPPHVHAAAEQVTQVIEGEVGIRVGGQVFRAPAGAYVITCRDANGRHQRILGPAHVKDSGRRTPSRAVVWRAADGPRPGPDWLTPDDAAAALRVLLAESRGRFAVRHGHEDGEVTLGGRPWHRRRQWTDLAAGFPV